MGTKKREVKKRRNLPSSELPFRQMAKPNQGQIGRELISSQTARILSLCSAIITHRTICSFTMSGMKRQKSLPYNGARCLGVT